MSEPVQYKNAPITEAIIDLKVSLPRPVPFRKLEQEAIVSATYTVQKEVMAFEVNSSMGAEVTASASQTPLGYLFSSADQRQVFQARQDGFTFSRLAPYEGWVPFRDEARRLWELYRSFAKPERITRLAVRNINRLDLPQPLVELKDYLRTLPEISPDMSQSMSAYFMQIQLPQHDLQAMLVITEAVIPPAQPDKVSVLLDIDLFSETEIAIEDGVVWDYFEQLRSRKNKVFEACITDRTKELIS